MPPRTGTSTVDPRVVYPKSRRTARVKFPASATRWKPITSAPSSPSMICVRHGSCE
jgi:hypothetical protein